MKLAEAGEGHRRQDEVGDDVVEIDEGKQRWREGRGVEWDKPYKWMAAGGFVSWYACHISTKWGCREEKHKDDLVRSCV